MILCEYPCRKGYFTLLPVFSGEIKTRVFVQDLCPEGYDLVRSGQCLKLFHDQVNRDSAKSQCEALGARLVSMRTQYQEDAVLDYRRHIANGRLLSLFVNTLCIGVSQRVF